MAAASAPLESAKTPPCWQPRGISPPLSHLRQVLALMLDPGLLALLGNEKNKKKDKRNETEEDKALAAACSKAQRLLAEFPGGSLGAYTHTGGQHFVRQACADYLGRRDCLPAPVDCVLVTCGTVETIRLLLEGFGNCTAPQASVLLPAPGRPVYSQLAKLFGVRPSAYRLSDDWQLCEDKLQAAYESAVSAGSHPRLLVLINPGYPAGQLLSPTSLRLAAEFAHRRRLLVIADEALQFSLHDQTVDGEGESKGDGEGESKGEGEGESKGDGEGESKTYGEGESNGEGDSEFVGFRRVVLSQPEWADSLEVASLASLSRAACPESGLRTGFCELLNLQPESRACLLSVLACSSCPPVAGQAALAIWLPMLFAGNANEANSEDTVARHELASAAGALSRKAALAGRTFAAAPSDCWRLGIAPRAGAWIYACVSLARPACTSSSPLDVDFCRQFLLQRESGELCEQEEEEAKAEAEDDNDGEDSWLRPGSDFGQPASEDGFYYLRISIESSEEVLQDRLNCLIDFHREWLLKHQSDY